MQKHKKSHTKQSKVHKTTPARRRLAKTNPDIKKETKKRATSKKTQKTALLMRTVPFLWGIGAILIVSLVAIATCWIVFFSQRAPEATQASDEKYFFADSKYQGIRSKFVTRDSSREKTSIEYPITKNNEINKITAHAIDTADTTFKEFVQNGSSNKEKMTETISYQVTHNTDTHLSIVIHIKQDMHGAHPVSDSYFWTFDKTTGKPITLNTLLENNKEDLAKVVTLARLAVKKSLKEQKQPPAELEDSLTTEILQNFLVADTKTISWPFGQSAFLASFYGEVTINLTVDALVKELQHPLAKQLFAVPEPPAPQPQPAPASPPVAQNTSCPQGRCVALTFDDGPGPYTNKLLDILSGRGAKATFFVLGSKVAGNAGTLQRAHKEGHQIGNHTWGHPDLSQLGPDVINGELARTSDAIRAAIGTAPNSARPPYGAMSPAVTTELAKLGMSAVLWSVDTRDWADRNSDIVCNRAVANARPGSIILLHDIHVSSVDAVPCILDTLSKQGYSFVTVNSILGTMAPGQTYYAG